MKFPKFKTLILEFKYEGEKWRWSYFEAQRYLPNVLYYQGELEVRAVPGEAEYLPIPGIALIEKIDKDLEIKPAYMFPYFDDPMKYVGIYKGLEILEDSKKHIIFIDALELDENDRDFAYELAEKGYKMLKEYEEEVDKETEFIKDKGIFETPQGDFLSFGDIEEILKSETKVVRFRKLVPLVDEALLNLPFIHALKKYFWKYIVNPCKICGEQIFLLNGTDHICMKCGERFCREHIEECGKCKEEFCVICFKEHRC